MRDDLRLGELVEPSACLEDERVLQDELLDAALRLHMEHLVGDVTLSHLAHFLSSQAVKFL